MVVTRLRLRDFRTYAAAEVGAGRAAHRRARAATAPARRTCSRRCTSAAPGARAGRPTSARSCASTRARRRVRVEVDGRDRDGEHELSVGFQPGEAKRFKVDGAPVERLLDAPHRPLVSVFLPDRLELVKGPPALRRAHLDQVVGALWPARAATRAPYAPGAGPAQRAARRGVRAGGLALGARGLGPRARAPRHRAARRPRRGAGRSCAARFAAVAAELGLAGAAELRYRPRTRGRDAPRSSRPSWRSAWTPTSSAASPTTARTATTSRCCATGASCAPTARRASSAWRCWRCCSPSARCSRTSAGRRRCCCSTTS